MTPSVSLRQYSAASYTSVCTCHRLFLLLLIFAPILYKVDKSSVRFVFRLFSPDSCRVPCAGKHLDEFEPFFLIELSAINSVNSLAAFAVCHLFLHLHSKAYTVFVSHATLFETRLKMLFHMRAKHLFLKGRFSENLSLEWAKFGFLFHGFCDSFSVVLLNNTATAFFTLSVKMSVAPRPNADHCVFSAAQRAILSDFLGGLLHFFCRFVRQKLLPAENTPLV